MAVSDDKQQVTVILPRETVKYAELLTKQQHRPSRSNTLAYLVMLGIERLEESKPITDIKAKPE